MHVRNDRREMIAAAGGTVLELASDEDQLTHILGNDRLHGELQRIALDATVPLLERGGLAMYAGVACQPRRAKPPGRGRG